MSNLSPTQRSSHLDYRESLITSLTQDLVGPSPNDPSDLVNEVLNDSPLQIYGAGILFPQNLSQEGLEDFGSVEDGDTEPFATSHEDRGEDIPNFDQGRMRGDSGDNTTSEDPALNLANQYSPSALGITFRVPRSSKLVLTVDFATYKTERNEEPDNRAGQTKLDGTPYPDTRTVTRYRRMPQSQLIDVPKAGERLTKKVVPIARTDGALSINFILRPRGEEILVSAMAVNNNTVESSHVSVESAFFQVVMSIKATDGSNAFLPIDRASGFSEKEELKSQALLYRHRRSFCLGHGCAGDWSRDSELEITGRTSEIRSTSLPLYEVFPVEPRTHSYGGKELDLAMYNLAFGKGATEAERYDYIISALQELCADYGAWILETEKQASSLNEQFREAADRHITACKACMARMSEGVSILSENRNSDAMRAFRLTNLGMLMQQVHSGISRRQSNTPYPELPHDYQDLDRRWRPFQLAFILINIAGIIESAHVDRSIVDLIWFPTGGGKTEAYLGVAAFTILVRRLRDPSDGGTTLIMRYTLRLLTAQQFQRASTLILALEKLRQNNFLELNLGEEEISIGLWVGQSLTPNKRGAAVKSLRALRTDRNAKNPFQVLSCPWCKHPYTESDNLGYFDVLEKGTTYVKFACPDSNCDWHSSSGNYQPILVVDEDIYDSPPTLVLGTVDKFAQLSWEPRTGQIFGKTFRHSPPELIIQDELHLISGPLGTIVGLYEPLIERLCSINGKIPKIVASTATIRHSAEQCRALYNREAFEFPPQGLKAGDSYFAFENTEAPGRQYLGVLPTGLKSHATAQVRVVSSLLQGVMPSHPAIKKDEQTDQKLPQDDYIKEADPYGTLVWYFNSLRELGHATTMCTGDIPEYLKGLCRRRDVPWDYRRRIREFIELTSRRSADEIPKILSNLELPWKPKPSKNYPVDILLATNMISVGVDVSRLGLMVVTGQPKNTSEYIQATSRVGRSHPGLVVTVYNQTKSRDRSHYEQFIGYHQAFYRFVEATSITPFSPPARARGLKGLIIAVARHLANVNEPNEFFDKRSTVEREMEKLLSRVSDIDASEVADFRIDIDDALAEWSGLEVEKFGRMAGMPNTTTLAYPFGRKPDPIFENGSWPVLTSMRNVDGTSIARIISFYPDKEAD